MAVSLLSPSFRLRAGENNAGRLRLLGAALVVVPILSLIPLLQPLLQNGDSAVYNEQVETWAIGTRTTHIGYMVLGIVFRTLLPGNTDYIMNLMTLVLGGVGILAIYFAAVRLTRSVIAGVLAALGLLSLPAYLLGMLLSEVDVPLAAMVALSFAFWLSARPRTAGVCFGGAMLISPLASLALPAFLATSGYVRHRPDTHTQAARLLELRPIVEFAVTSLAVYLPVVIVFYQSYFFGARGLMVTARFAYNLGRQSLRSYTFYRSQLSILFPLLAYGVIVAGKRGLPGLAAAVGLAVMTSMILGERFGSVPVQLTAATLSTLFLAFTIVERPRALRGAMAMVVLLAIAWNGWNSLHTVRSKMARCARRRAAYLTMKEKSPYPVLLIVRKSRFHDSVRFERIVYGKTKIGKMMARSRFQKRCRTIAAGEEPLAIWFETDAGKVCPELLARYEWSRIKVQKRKLRVLMPRPGFRAVDR